MTQINQKVYHRDKSTDPYAIAEEAKNSIAQTLANCKRKGSAVLTVSET
ncbi:MAG: hypothetical protein G5701_09035 [Serratia symbiotica]|nr:hypothetical protein [Serratia symbiotica]